MTENVKTVLGHQMNIVLDQNAVTNQSECLTFEMQSHGIYQMLAFRANEKKYEHFFIHQTGWRMTEKSKLISKQMHLTSNNRSFSLAAQN